MEAFWWAWVEFVVQPGLLDPWLVGEQLAGEQLAGVGGQWVVEDVTQGCVHPWLRAMALTNRLRWNFAHHQCVGNFFLKWWQVLQLGDLEANLSQ